MFDLTGLVELAPTVTSVTVTDVRVPSGNDRATATKTDAPGPSRSRLVWRPAP